MRAKIQVTDVVSAATVVIPFIALYPVYTSMIADLTAETGPFSDVLLELLVPSVFLAIIISMGMSAMRRWGGNR